jgi:DNA-directed RNA polymerase specialized sigma24 family protein
MIKVHESYKKLGISKEVYEFGEEILKGLPSQQHRVLEELYLQDKTQEQVATTLCCTTRYIRKCKNLGLKNIKKKLHSS